MQVNNKTDNLVGLKENVIIGKLIPAGTGSPYERETTELVEARAQELIKERQEHYEELQKNNVLPDEVVSGGVSSKEEKAAK